MIFPMRVQVTQFLMIALSLGLAGSTQAASNETSNGCRNTEEDPCIRSGSCEIQGALWDQDVTIDRSDIFDTQGWPGLCDMVHVGLVQGSCEPPGAQTAVTVHLSDISTAWIPEIIGPLACADEPEPPKVPAMGILGQSILIVLIVAGSLVRVRSLSD